MQKLRVSQSLLSAWQYVFKTDTGYDDFLKALNRIPKQPNEAMLLGTRYENVLNNVLNGVHIPEDHEWYSVVTEMAAELEGSQQQVELYKDICVDGQPVLLHGILDYLKAGKIYDCKFSKHYHLNKYLQSPQHPLYMRMVEQARDFTYIITDGNYVYREIYPREIIDPIELTVHQFYEWLKAQGLFEIYKEKWSGKHK